VAYALGWFVTCCCGLPTVLVFHALGLRLACYLTGVDVPGFVKSLGVGAFSLVVLLAVQVFGAVYLGVGPFSDLGQTEFLLVRVVMFTLLATGFALVYVPVLDVRFVQALRVVLVQMIYVLLFVIGWLLLANLR
jgi:hypothetical protein